MACLRRPVRRRLPEVGVDVCPGMKKAPTTDIGTTTLLSAVLSVLLSLIVAALIGSRVGDDYQTRALVYVSLLLWSVVGAGVLSTSRTARRAVRP